MEIRGKNGKERYGQYRHLLGIISLQNAKEIVQMIPIMCIWHILFPFLVVILRVKEDLCDRIKI